MEIRKLFLYCQNSPGGMTHFTFEGDDAVAMYAHDLHDWMKEYKDVDQAMLDWAETAEIGDTFIRQHAETISPYQHEVFGIMIRLKDQIFPKCLD